MAKLIIAEDETHMLRLLEMTLRKKGHTWTVCRNGREAVESARTQPADCIIMDVMMPEMNGLTALAELKKMESARDIPVIMLTARGQFIDREEAESSGAAVFLTKPYSPTELLNHIDRLTASAPGAGAARPSTPSA